MYRMDQQEFRERIRARLRETGDTPVRVAERAGLPRDSIRSVLRGHEPSISRADEICRALGVTVTIGVRRAMPQSVKAAHPRISDPPAVSQERTAVECFADIVDGRLADLFGSVVEVYNRARNDAERRLMAGWVQSAATMASDWIAEMEEFSTPPMKRLISAEEIINDE